MVYRLSSIVFIYGTGATNGGSPIANENVAGRRWRLRGQAEVSPSAMVFG